MKPIIQVRELSKRYRLGAQRARYATLRESLVNAAKAPLRALRGGSGDDDSTTIWALRDVSFEVMPGEVVGVIGRNGAGKSTLLKVLSRITEPTGGEVKLFGRVASLLEVGTGFHPELTGRENILLNGAILGMKRTEIARKFDEIVAFAEVERFLDTPVKHYSSGMYVRLAFAVAAHLEPEILLIDEVLAVGDAEFQKKCLGKMDEVARLGRTVLFVSHNMGAVTRLCRRAVRLDQGALAEDGEVTAVTANYLRGVDGSMGRRLWPDPARRPGDDVARLAAVQVSQGAGPAETVDIREPVTVTMEFECLAPQASLLPVFTFFNDQGVAIFLSADFEASRTFRRGLHRASCTIPGNLLSEGVVRVVAEVSTREPLYRIHLLEWDAVGFNVVDTGEPGSVRAGWGRPLGGAVRPRLQWRFEMPEGVETSA